MTIFPLLRYAEEKRVKTGILSLFYNTLPSHLLLHFLSLLSFLQHFVSKVSQLTAGAVLRIIGGLNRKNSKNGHKRAKGHPLEVE